MNTLSIIFGAVSLLAIGLLLYVLREIRALHHSHMSDKSSELLNQNVQSMHQRLDAATKILNERLDASHKTMLNSHESMSKVMGTVGQELGTVKEIGHQLSKFQEFLNSPKLRGNLGEHILYDSLAKILPKDAFTRQHTFKTGACVDALIITDKGHIPIDSKFPMEDFQALAKCEDEKEIARLQSAFNRSSKKHVDAISNKYILPAEGTVDFALMYVPAEQVYYEMVSGDHGVAAYAQQKKVIMVSPNTFFHFLRVVLMGLERSKVNDEAEKVWKMLTSLQHDFTKFGKQIDILQKHISHASSAVEGVSSDYTKIGLKFDNIKQLD
ncbi:MAG: hypothetical protein CMI52_04970 [Parcubacteria group bacterium]|nr:hypothetical protein [Parcubacteria group bacterium]